ncbi:hypothetical protein ASE90_05375 [Sphingomonas sp. Leaf67]|nr:hypothetical protein ASE90_05375 [Sphingomonas sp. Leaf67]
MFLGIASPAKHVTFVIGIIPRQTAFDVMAVMYLQNDVRSGAKTMGALTAMQFNFLDAVSLPFLLPIKLHRLHQLDWPEDKPT